MKNNKLKIALVALAAIASGQFAYSEDYSTTTQDLAQRSHTASVVISEVQATPDRSIPDSLLQKATCVATIPQVIRVAFIFGGRFGKGLVSCRTVTGWSQASYLTLAGGSWGFQAGVDSTDVVLVFVRPNAIDKFSANNFTVGADASVTAGPVGRNAAAGTDYQLSSEIFSYSRSRGLFAGLSLDGTALSVDKEANALIYGPDRSARDILMHPTFVGMPIHNEYVQTLMEFVR